jgi:hypothetical protein
MYTLQFHQSYPLTCHESYHHLKKNIPYAVNTCKLNTWILIMVIFRDFNYAEHPSPDRWICEYPLVILS